MVFSSLVFLLGFLPVCLAACRIAPNRWKNAVLFLFSLLFYAWGEPLYVGLMLFSTALDYGCGRAAERFRGTPGAKAALILSVTANLTLLGVFKYSDFLLSTCNSLFGTALPLPQLALPIGISFYTFQTMSYTIDVYRGEVPVQRNFISFGAYVSMFPQLIAGPIVRYREVSAQLDCRTQSAELFASSVRRFVCGAGKKLLLANQIGLLRESLSFLEQPTVLAAWLGVTAVGFQIYFDFSGYSDMAIGLGRMLGFRFPENFRYPFLADSVTEFWRRWHMTLGAWFRDYVYIPLGGNRCSRAKQVRNLAAVWLLTGFWHGASWNYVLWGCYFGVVLIGEKLVLQRILRELPALLRHLYTWILLGISWALFGFEDLSRGLLWISAMFGGTGAGIADGATLYQLTSYGPLLLLCALASTPLGLRLYRRLNEKWSEGWMLALDCCWITAALALCTARLISDSYNPFLYFRF